MKTMLLVLVMQLMQMPLACSRNGGNDLPQFHPVPDKTLFSASLYEISGIADSKNLPGHLWGIEDSGNPPHLYLLDHQAELKKTIFLHGVINRDWEELQLSGGRLYIAETGDNALQFTEYAILHFPEPSIAADTIKNIQRIRFRYSDGPHDSEAFLVHPQSNDIYLFSKEGNETGIYRISYPYQDDLNIAQKLGQLPYAGVVGAALTPSGDGILLKTYAAVRYYPVGPGENFVNALGKNPHQLPYVAEPQGEAISYALKNDGYFTLSERSWAAQNFLYFYRKK